MTNGSSSYDDHARKKEEDELRRATAASMVNGDASARYPSSMSFRLDGRGVWYVDREGKEKDAWICSPLEVLGNVRNHDGEDWGFLLEWSDRENRRHRWAMPAALLAGDENEYRRELRRCGLRMANGSKARERLSSYIDSCDSDIFFWCVATLGWYGAQFVLPDGAISEPGDDPAIFAPLHNEPHHYKVAGSLDDWTNKVGKLCRGNSRLLLAVSSAFAGPLLKLLEAESGGFHFLGLSSLGKTTALIAAGSVLGGGGKRGFINTWLSTLNAMEWTAESHNDLTLMLDEINLVDPNKAIDAAYMLTSNEGKGRANKSGGTRATATWRLLLLSSGEESLEQHAATAGRISHGGAQIRFANIPADAGSGFGMFEDIHGSEDARKFAVLLRGNALRFYGTPIRAFLERIVKDRSVIQERVPHACERFLQEHRPARASEEVLRVLGRFAVAAVAGELATEWGITGWVQGEAERAAVQCFDAWRASRPGDGATDDENAIRQVRSKLLATSCSCFQAMRPRLDHTGEPIRELIARRFGFRDENEEGTTVHLVFRDAFRDEFCKGFDAERVARLLADRKFLERDKDGKHLAIQRTLPGLGRTRVYVILPTMFDEIDENKASSSASATENS
jgi:putative DNA primase/helicase